MIEESARNNTSSPVNSPGMPIVATVDEVKPVALLLAGILGVRKKR